MNVPITIGNLPSGFCPSDYQTMINGFGQVMSVSITDSISQLQVQAAKPSDTTKAWLQLDSFGRPVRLYWFAQGAWLSQHPLLPGFTMPWFAALPTFTTYDGGDANGLSPISGPMWELVTGDPQARIPIAAGTTALGTVITQGQLLGEEKHLLTADELPAHKHLSPFINDTARSSVEDLGGSEAIAGAGNAVVGATGIEDGRRAHYYTKVNTTLAQAHNTLPLAIGMNWLRRTQRVFYAVS